MNLYKNRQIIILARRLVLILDEVNRLRVLSYNSDKPYYKTTYDDFHT